MEEKKFKSLLKFYKKNGVAVELKIKNKGGVTVKGKIIKLKRVFGEYIILKSEGKSPIKIFLEDIMRDSILPEDFAGESDKNKDKKISRSGIPPKLRFAVLRRDKYVCRYCGACGPNVEVEVDHVTPVSKGGKTEMANLKTACIECNRGKGDNGE